MRLLARFRLEQAAQNIRPEGTPDCSQPSTPTHSHAGPGLSFPRSSNSPNSPGFPPGQPRRWEHSASSEDLEAEHLLKRKKLHALDTCRENQLDDNALDQFAEFDVPQMLIALQGKLMALERERLHDETQDFIRSHAFKDILKDRLRACLLSPNLSRYLDGLSEHIWGFIKRNPGIFKVPARVLEDPELSDCIDTLIKDILTKQRSQIKFKIANSITKQHHISQLAKSLAQKDFIDVTRAQWARIAFLHQNMLFFNKLVTESMNKKLGVPDPEQGDGDSLDSNNNSEE
ncbi:hypothetical protein JVT61DRAFT_8019 [Boletus reticuloceps]|uniref:Uncharacterized protein n=1 Tax=Boletus reticuloceps TaxID=495285 RepID=A0A8I2YH84_9AGAM|nr:hypothetical protein JVT61DRAFT_8019 [Boletus reticuloceps]